MTYGEVATQLRDSLTELLAHPKPYYEIGGRRFTDGALMPLVQERADLIQRYRALVLQYVVELARTHTVGAPSGASLVRRWLDKTERSIPPRDQLPDRRYANGLELGTEQDNVVVELWRKAAVAAFIAREREFGPMREQMTAAQTLVVPKDVADVMLALIRLDYRYRRLPGWHGLVGVERTRPDRGLRAEPTTTARGLSATTQHFSDWITTQLTPEGYTVDSIGHRAEPTFSPAGGTIEAAITALENLIAIIDADFPRALSLRMLLRSQWKLSVLATKLAHASGDTTAAGALTVRGQVYAGLISAMRNVTGTLGDGIYAVSYGGVATDQIARTTSATTEETAQLLEVLDRVDARIAQVTRKGAATGAYVMATGEVALVKDGPGGIHRPHATFAVITPHANPYFYRLLSALEPHARPLVPDPTAMTKRAEFAAMLGLPPQASLARSDAPDVTRSPRQRGKSGSALAR